MLTLRKILTNGEIVNVTGPIDLGPNCAVEYFDVDENFIVLSLDIRHFDDDGEENNRQFLISIRSTQDLQVIRTVRASNLFGLCDDIIQDYLKGFLIEKYSPYRQTSQHAQMELLGGHHLNFKVIKHLILCLLFLNIDLKVLIIKFL